MTVEELINLRHARDLIDREFARPLDVPTMARAAHMSPSHFARRYRETFGETPQQHLLTRRIERARALLRAGELPVTEVCVAFQAGEEPVAERACVGEGAESVWEIGAREVRALGGDRRHGLGRCELTVPDPTGAVPAAGFTRSDNSDGLRVRCDNK